MDGDELIASVYRKIERERALIAAATNMKQSTSNPMVKRSVDSNIRESQKNIVYLEEKLRELEIRMQSQDGGVGSLPPQLPPLGDGDQRRSGGGYDAAPAPPPKDPSRGYLGQSDYGDPGPGGYSQGGTGQMPSRAPYSDPRPFAPVPKARPNYSKLGISLYFEVDHRRA